MDIKQKNKRIVQWLVFLAVLVLVVLYVEPVEGFNRTVCISVAMLVMIMTSLASVHESHERKKNLLRGGGI